MALREKSFIVVGGGNLGGICNTFVIELLKSSIEKVAVFDIVDEDAFLSDLRSKWPNNSVIYNKVDVRSKTDLQQAFRNALQEFGSIDFVINGAGIVNENNIEDTLHTNLFGVIYGTQCGIDNMSITNGHKGGCIVNIASITGLKPYSQAPAYTASKHAVVGYTRAIGESPLSAAFGIKFIAICPGFTDTSLVQTMSQRLYHPRLQLSEMSKSRDMPMQSSDVCAKLMLEILGKCDETTVWVIEDSKCWPARLLEQY